MGYWKDQVEWVHRFDAANQKLNQYQAGTNDWFKQLLEIQKLSCIWQATGKMGIPGYMGAYAIYDNALKGKFGKPINNDILMDAFEDFFMISAIHQDNKQIVDMSRYAMMALIGLTKQIFVFNLQPYGQRNKTCEQVYWWFWKDHMKKLKKGQLAGRDLNKAFRHCTKLLESAAKIE